LAREHPAVEGLGVVEQLVAVGRGGSGGEQQQGG